MSSTMPGTFPRTGCEFSSGQMLLTWAQGKGNRVYAGGVDRKMRRISWHTGGQACAASPWCLTDMFLIHSPTYHPLFSLSFNALRVFSKLATSSNYVMAELLLVRPEDQRFLDRAGGGLRFLVFDELHTYRGRQGADVAMLIRRLKERCAAPNLVHVGT